MKDTIKSFLSVAAVIAVFLTVQVYIELQDKSAEQTIHAQAAQITALNRTVSAVLAERDQARSDLAQAGRQRCGAGERFRLSDRDRRRRPFAIRARAN